MFNKKVLGSGLVAMAVSLGANAMHNQDQQAQKECSAPALCEKKAKKEVKHEREIIPVCDAKQDKGSSQQSDCNNEEVAVAQCGSTMTQDQCATQCGQDTKLAKAFKGNLVESCHADGHRLGAHHKLIWEDQTGTTFNKGHYVNMDWKKVDFQGSQFNDVVMTGKMEKVNFNNTQINLATINGNLMGVTFKGATISNTNFQGAQFGRGGFNNIRHSSFAGAKLENVNFNGATFKGNVSFKGAQFGNNVNFEGAQIEAQCDGAMKLVTITKTMANHLMQDAQLVTSAGLGLAQWVTNKGLGLAASVHNTVHDALHSDSSSSDEEGDDGDCQGGHHGHNKSVSLSVNVNH